MKKISLLFLALYALGFFCTAHAAYYHMGEADSPKFQQAYPALAGSRLDSCTLCHCGGQYVDTIGNTRTLGTCQWCHYTYGYDGSGDINKTMNPYGKDYLAAGRSVGAFAAIESKDSDGDGYTNKQELDALTFPGDPKDNPLTKPAPRITYSLNEIENNLPHHRQFLLLNTNRSGDYYAEYEGIPLYDLLIHAGMDEATTSGVAAFSPDGFSYVYDLNPGGESYYVKGIYPEAVYYYDPQADKANGGWCDYSAPSCKGRKSGDKITVEGGLKLILAYLRDGADMETGYLDDQNRLNGEGPFRTVPPQMIPGPPDQLSTAATQDVIWPYDNNADHNAGFSERTVVAIRIEPLPEGTSDFDWSEGGWDYVDNKQLIIYGNLINGSIAGTVKDVATQSPIEKASVTTDKGGYSARTDVTGTFALSGLVVGSYAVTVSASGYQAQTKSITLAKDETEALDFTLTPGGGTTCPVASVAGKNQGLLLLLRSYRDRVLAHSDAGKQYIKLYYAHAGELNSLLLGSSATRQKFIAALDSIIPSIQRSLKGEAFTISTAQAQKFDDLTAAVKPVASPGLRAAISRVIKKLKDGTFAQELAITLKK